MQEKCSNSSRNHALTYDKLVRTGDHVLDYDSHFGVLYLYACEGNYSCTAALMDINAYYFSRTFTINALCISDYWMFAFIDITSVQG